MEKDAPSWEPIVHEERIGKNRRPPSTLSIMNKKLNLLKNSLSGKDGDLDQSMQAKLQDINSFFPIIEEQISQLEQVVESLSKNLSDYDKIKEGVVSDDYPLDNSP